MDELAEKLAVFEAETQFDHDSSAMARGNKRRWHGRDCEISPNLAPSGIRWP